MLASYSLRNSPIVIIPLVALAIVALWLAPLPAAIAISAASVVLTVLLATLGGRKITYAPMLLLGGVVVGQLLRYEVTKEASAALLVVDWLAVIYVSIGSLFLLLTRRPLIWTVSLSLLMLFLAWGALSLFIGSAALAPREILIAFLYFVRLVVLTASLGITATLLIRPKDEHRLWNGLLVTGLILAGLGFLQLLIFPNFAFMARYGWDPHQGRLLSTFFDPNFFGMFLVMILSLAFSQLLLIPEKRVQAGITILPLLAALLLTFSRSSYLALFISLIIILTIRSWRLVFLALLVISLAGASIPRVRDRVVGAITLDTTARDRIQSWQETFVIIKDTPWTGVGYNAFGPAQIHYNLKKDLHGHSSHGSDSSLLLAFATTGIIGFVLYLLFWLAVWYEALLVYRFHKSLFFQGTGLALLGIVPAYLVHSQFVNGLFYPLLFLPFGFIVALLYRGLRSMPQPLA